MVLLRLSTVAAIALVALTLLAWLASARPPGAPVLCGDDGRSYQVCHARLLPDRRPLTPRL